MRHHLHLLLLVGLTACVNHVPRLERLPGDTEAPARAIVARAVEAHGGYAAFLQAGDLRARLDDDWQRPALGPDYPDDHEGLVLTWNPELDKGLLEFEGTGRRWGHDSVEGWTALGDQRTYDQLDEATFSVPTIGYFLSLPFRLLDGGLRYRLLDDEQHDGRALHRVAISFDEGLGTATDRYLVRLDAQTGRLVDVAFTVFDVGGLPQGLASYRDSTELDGLILPTEIDIDLIRPGLLRGDLHTYRITSYERLDGFDRSEYEKPDARTASR